MRALRHASTHRFAVLHDFGPCPKTQDGFVEHYDFEDYRRKLIESLQLARAVLIYFVQRQWLTVRHESPRKEPSRLTCRTMIGFEVVDSALPVWLESVASGKADFHTGLTSAAPAVTLNVGNGRTADGQLHRPV